MLVESHRARVNKMNLKSMQNNTGLDISYNYVVLICAALNHIIIFSGHWTVLCDSPFSRSETLVH